MDAARQRRALDHRGAGLRCGCTDRALAQLTRKKRKEIWIRRTFELLQVPDDLRLIIHHDEDAEVLLNGVPAATLQGSVTDYTIVPLAPQAIIALWPGRNLIAIHCSQTSGGQYIDAGLVQVSLP
jgi:hypothetical protein